MMDGFKNSAAKTSLFLLLFLTTTFFGIPQNLIQNNPPPKVTHVENTHYDSMEIDENIHPDIWVYFGNVTFRHDSTYMYCDSAYLNHVSNYLEAFSNVRIEQGDTLFIYGDFLNYYGNSRLAKMRENVKMENNEVTLFTDSFDYDRNKNLAYYFDGGMLVDSLNELISEYGQYSPDTKVAFFRNKVKMVNSNFILTTDTLLYNTETKIATIVSPTVIESDSGFVYSSRGWYNTITEESMLYDRSVVVSKDNSKTITADSIYYNKVKGFVEAFGNMILNDTVQKAIVMGNYGYYDEKTEFAFATDSAQVIEYSQRDSSYLHADSIFMRTFEKEREVKAYYGVRFYRVDLQSICDSMQYFTGDSILRLYKNPVLWNEAYQINGDTINILFNDSTIERMHVLNYAYTFEEVDSTYYNQLKGRNLTAYFEAGEINRIEVEGNGEAIYYSIEDKNAAPLQLFKFEAPFLAFKIESRKIEEILWHPEPKLTIIPIPDLTPDMKFLPGFVDYNYIRPKNKEDIFMKTEMKTEDIPQRRVRQRSQQE